MIGIGSKLINSNDFEKWCKVVGDKILEEKILNSENIGFKLKSHIINNEDGFYTCLKNDTEKEVDRLKVLAKKYHGVNKSKYIEIGLKLSVINKRLKEYNLERTKAFQRNEYVLFKQFLKSKGLEHLHKEYAESKRVDG